MISLVGLQIEKLDARQGPGLPSGDLAWTAVAAPGLRLPYHSSSVPRLCLASLSFNGDCLVFGPRHFLCILFVSPVNKNKETNSFRIFYNG